MANIVFFSLLFSPDGVSTAQLVTDLAIGLKEKGHKITVVAGKPHYNVDSDARAKQHLERRFGGLLFSSEIGGVKVYHVPILPKGNRVYSRILDYLTYHIYSTVYGLLFLKGGDLIFSTTPPPTIGLNAWFIARIRKKPFIYNIREIFPDVLTDMGLIKNKTTIQILRWLESKVYENCDAIVVLSDNFQEILLEKGAPRHRLHMIPDFIDLDFIRPQPKENDFSERLGLCDKFVVQYAGNIGLTQGFDLIIEAARNLAGYSDIRFLVVGGGARYDWLENEIAKNKLENIILRPYQPRNMVPYIYGTADICLIVLKGDTAKTTIPSKIYTIMGSARPALVSADSGSELSRLVERAGCGWIVKPDDPAALTEGILAAYEAKDNLPAMGRNGRVFVEKFFSKEYVISRYDDLIGRLLVKTGDKGSSHA